MAKYDANGDNVWAKAANGNGNEANSGTSICTDKDGNVYVTGFFQFSVAFGKDTLGNTGNNISIFIAKYDSVGNALWGRSPGGTGFDYGTSITADSSGNVFMTGYFTSSYLNFGGIPVLNDFTSNNDIFVAEYNSDGNSLWAEGIGGQDNDYGMGICNAGGNVYVSGYFGSFTINFGSTTITNKGGYDIFLAKLDNITGIQEKTLSQLNIFPNPSNGCFTILAPSAIFDRTITIYNIVGENIFSDLFIGEQKVINSNLKEGIYLIQIADGLQTITKKMIIE